MNLFKVGCSNCSESSTCSSKTRMYVNYCGSRRLSVEKRIREAKHECRTRRGVLLLTTTVSGPKNALNTVSKVLTTKPLRTAVAVP